MMDKNLSEKDAVIALLPFYESGNIDPDDAALVEAWLDNDPEAEQILAKVREERSITAHMNETIVPPKGGLDRLMADVARTSQEKTLKTEGASLLSWVDRVVLSPLRAAPSELAWAACGVLMLVSIGQTVLLTQMGGRAGSGYELASGERYEFVGKGLVQFVPKASLGEISELLDQVGAVIVDGPTASGQFVVGFVQRDGAGALSEREALLGKDNDLIVFFARQELDKPSD